MARPSAAPRLFTQAVDALRAASSSSSASSSSRRLASTSTSASSSSYPFNPNAIHVPSTVASPAPANLVTPKRGWSLIIHLSRAQLSLSPSPYAELFSRRSPDRLRTGSVVTVLTYTDSTKKSISPFSGVLMGVYRSQNGLDTSFKLRNIVNKTGVEMKFKLHSPLIKEIKIVKRAEGRTGGIKDLRRAKVTYLRDRPSIMASIAGALKAAKR